MGKEQNLLDRIQRLGTSSTSIFPANKDYNKIKIKMRQLIRMAKDVIEETEKESPNDVYICDIAIEEMSELFEEISSAILGGAQSGG